MISVLKKLLNGKATGIDGIPNRVLKDSAELIAPFLTDLFNFSINTKTYPGEFKTAKVAPVFKKGDKADLNNYRPISVLPTVARVFEKLIYNQLYKFLVDNNLLCNKQYGFRSLHSTALALGKVTNRWLLSFDKGCMRSVVFLDIKKAFDTVDHQILIQKLDHYGFQGNELDFIESYLDNRQQCCQIEGYTSSMRKISCGVPQGSILGPLLFIMYMNDLPSAVPDVDITMYADDTAIDTAFRTVGEIKQPLLPAFFRLCQWLDKNKLSLNVVKTEFMILGTNSRLRDLDSDPASTPYILSVGNIEIKRVKSTKYLGLIVDDTLSWSDHINHISMKIKRSIGVLKRTRSYLPRASLITLYRTLIETHLRYCSVIWGQCGETLKDKLQALQNRALRTIAGQKFEHADHSRLLVGYGLLSVQNLIKMDMGICVYKILNDQAPEEFKHIFQPVSSMHGYQTRSSQNNNLHLPQLNLKSAQGAISYAGVKIWNDIPPEIRKAESIVTFKKQFKEHLMMLQTV